MVSIWKQRHCLPLWGLHITDLTIREHLPTLYVFAGDAAEIQRCSRSREVQGGVEFPRPT